MRMLEIFLIGIGLAMDAFAASICKGLSLKRITIKNVLTIALYFGVFQAFMPVLGYLLGKNFENYVIHIDHWIAFILLGYIGVNMIREAFNIEAEDGNDDLSFKTMLPLALATSIDALAIGITFAFLQVNILHSSISIGIITFIVSLIGAIIGNKFGKVYEKRAEIFGGIILIAIGIKILIEHLVFN